MIKVNNVSKYFDDFKVLDDISMNVRKGTIYGLVGANGAGKTTILNHISGAYRPDGGQITVDDKPVWENDDIKQRVITIADDWYFYPTYTVKQMAMFYKSIYKNFSMERYNAIKKVFDIDEKRQIRKFSKGMKKQVAFWLSLSAMPDVLILDEPLDGLDPVMRKQVLSLVISDVSQRDMTVIVSSHNLRELEDICDWVGIIHKGKMIIEKPLDDLKGSVTKYQIVTDDQKYEQLSKDPDVLHISKTGSVCNVIIRGSVEQTEQKIKGFSTLLCEHIGLTLEEVFIYELGGLGYDFKNIII